MKALILNGAEKGDETLSAVHEIIAAELKGVGWEVDSFILHETKIADCLGYFRGWIKTPGVCIIDDAARDVARAVVRSDLLIFLTPVTFGGYSSELKKALDRSISIISPFFIRIDGEVHHEPRYERYPSIVGVGVLPHPDEESEQIFKTLVGRNAINFHAPAHAGGVVLSSQGTAEMRGEIKALFGTVGVGR
jgi:multimeric flavodoxin WrbA